MIVRNYKDLHRLETFEERFEYLLLSGEVGDVTFGFSRYLNQSFYHSPEWIHARREVIARDQGCDLGVEDRVIFFKPVIHHMNPITEEQILERDPSIVDPDYLITVSQETHRAIHYGNIDGLPPSSIVVRKPNDTKLW